MRVLLPALVSVSTVACTVTPTNPFDPDTTPEAQARASVTGRVRAVFARTAAGEPTVAGPCPDLADLADSDASGFRLVLRGIREGSAVTAVSQETNDTGAFVFDPVSPGTYTLEVIHEDFATPPVLELTLGIGQDRVLDDLCAINLKGPPAPVIAPLPDLMRSGEGPVDVVIDVDDGCDPADGCAVAWEVTQQRDGAAPRIDVVDAGAAAVPVILTDGDAAPARTAIRVDVVAIDALGNRSAATTDVIVVDDLAPAPPALAAPVVGRDRLTIAWEPVAGGVGDDGAASYLLFYGLLPRTDDDLNAVVRDECPFGRPRFDDDGAIVDDNGRARFALEGESPLATTTTSQTLSGIGPGTDVVVHVAAVDAAGNAGCYSAPQVARPDEVVFAAAPGRAVEGVVAGALRAAAIDGLVDGSLALARGSAGLAIVDGDGVLHVDATPTVDVVADGRRFVAAAGVAGVRIVPVDELGAPVAASARTVAVGGADVVGVSLRPGVAVAAARTGIAFVDLAAGTASALVNPGGRGTIVDVASFGEVLVIARQDGLQVVERAPPHRELGFAPLAAAPVDLLVHDDAAVVALGSLGVSAFDLAGCAVGADCLVARGRRALPRAGSARSLAAFDEGVAVGVVEAGDVAAVLVLDPRAALGIIGRTATTAAAPLLVDDGLLCVAGGDAATACHTPIVGPILEAERRLTTTGDVKRSRLAGAHVVAFEEAGVAGEVGAVVRAPLATMVAGTVATIPGRGGDLRQIDPLGGVVLEDGRVVVVDGTARVFVAQPARNDDAALLIDLGPTLVAQLPDLGDPADVDTGTYVGFVERLGSDLLVTLVDSGGDAGLVRLPLLDGDAGLVAGSPTSLALPDVDQTTNLVLRRGRAFIPSIPFGLTVVDVDGALAIDAAASVAVGSGGNADDVAFVAIDGASLTGLLVGTRPEGQRGLFGLDLVGIGAPDDVGVANALVGLHRFLVASANELGVITLLADIPGGDVGLVPVLELSTPSQVQDTRPTVRGLIASDSAGGVVRLVLR